jgi:hypothetical protein
VTFVVSPVACRASSHRRVAAANATKAEGL